MKKSLAIVIFCLCVVLVSAGVSTVRAEEK